MLQMLNEELVDPDKLLSKPRKLKDGKLSGLRVASNTLDLRGKGFQEAQDLTSSFLERAASRDIKDQLGVVYINHGNMKSADSTKAKLRAWLKKNALIRKVAPAELSDGGDAFTVLELDLDD
jgi:DNA-nicking Smr family endonuclease